MFNVVFLGLQEHDVEAVARLARLFNTTDEKIRALLGHGSIVIKRGLAEEAAKRYQQAITSAGGRCALEPESLEVDLPEEPVPLDVKEPPAAGSRGRSEFSAPPEHLLDALNGRTAASVGRLFVYQFMSTALRRATGAHLAPNNRREHWAEGLRSDMGDLSFWARCALFPEATSIVGQQMADGEVRELEKMAGRLTASSIDTFMQWADPSEDVDVDELTRYFKLLRMRYCLEADGVVTKACSAAERPKASSAAGVIKQLDAAYERELTRGSGAAAPTLTAANSSDSTHDGNGDLFNEVLGAVTITVLVAGATFYGVRMLGMSVLAYPIAAIVAAGTFLFFAWAQHSEGKVVIFTGMDDGIRTLVGGILVVVGLGLTLVFDNLWFRGAAFAGSAGVLWSLFSASARANKTLPAFFMSVLAKLALMMLFLLAIALLAAIRSKEEKEGESIAKQLARQQSERLQEIAAIAAVTAGSVAISHALSTEVDGSEGRGRFSSWVWALSCGIPAALAVAVFVLPQLSTDHKPKEVTVEASPASAPPPSPAPMPAVPEPARTTPAAATTEATAATTVASGISQSQLDDIYEAVKTASAAAPLSTLNEKAHEFCADRHSLDLGCGLAAPTELRLMALGQCRVSTAFPTQDKWKPCAEVLPGEPARPENFYPMFYPFEGYGSAREKLLVAGWQPVKVQGADKCKEDDTRCVGRPEMKACSGTGLAGCLFVWRKADVTLTVATVGEEAPWVQMVFRE